MIDNRLNERRSSPRIEGTYFARYRFFYPYESRLDIQEYEASTLDISKTGVALVTDKKIPVGSNLLIKFSIKRDVGNTLSSYRKIIVFTGKVVYAAPMGEYHYRIGIFFESANEQNEIKFIEILASPSQPFQVHSRRYVNATLHVGTSYPLGTTLKV